jgi:hypothetical protein
MNDKSNEKSPATTGDPEFERILEEEEAKEKAANFQRQWKRGFSAGAEAEAHIITNGGRVVPTQVVRGFSKPKALFVLECEDYVKGFYPTLELTSGVHAQVGKFCHTLEESEGIITLILAEVRRKAATY